MNDYKDLIHALRQQENLQKAAFVSRYFKTGKGQYGQGDIFLGLTVPQTRTIAHKYVHLSLNDIQKLLKDPIHEVRQATLMILGQKFRKAGEADCKKIFYFYLKNTAHINNWDLIDGSAPTIVGGYLLDKPKERKILYTLARSNSLWERRIAVLATFTFLKNKQFNDTFAMAEILLHDSHDLIHKSVGWMLREVGKIDQSAEESFLKKHYKVMPSTMLRYSIERFSSEKRKYYLS